MKRIAVFMLLLLLCAGTGCSFMSKKPALGLLIYDEADTFMMEMKDYAVKRAGEDFTLSVNYAERNQLFQNQQIVTMMDENVDAMIINAVDRLACSAISEKLSKADIPTIFINREPLASDIKDKANVFYIGAAAGNLGAKQADMASALFRDSPYAAYYDKNKDGIMQTVILKGEQGHQDAELRTRRCIEKMQKNGYRVEVLEIKVANWNRDEGKAAMEELYKTYGDSIELIFSNNDDMALGAIDYMLEEKLVREHGGDYFQDFVIIGVDGTAAGTEAVEKGLMYGTVLNDAPAQIDAALTLISCILEGKGLEDFPYIITNEKYIYIDGKAIINS